MAKRANGEGFLTGGRDGRILFWTSDVTIVISMEINLESLKKKLIIPNTTIIALSQSSDGKNLIVGLRGAQIIEFRDSVPTIV